ncbi:ATP-binding cassette domain-containing protein [Panacibacter sp. DH6]|uniref:ATP-binding cassette domain-containing protein n=1 Tax=Panacibacter microcysteis TaxID=2793269 RepID=A0A931MCJ1_9BACT|nr:ATP-binding cassette domain-containing protein [Panacibacter microcysteis]MBG9378097.1 ATP-binding cassette domain-containing protein [Panacibacter microcysteis]
MADLGTNVLGRALSRFFSFLKADKKDFYAIYAYAIFSGLLALSVPLGIQTIISFVLAGSISTSMVVLICFVVVGVFFTGLLQVKQMQVVEKIEQKIFVRYAFEFTDRLPKINVQKMDSYYLPELVNRFFDTVSLQKGIGKLLIDIPTATIQLLFGLILLSFYHPVFIVFGIALFLVLILILRFTSVKGMETNVLASDFKFSVAGWIEEIARTVKTFKYSKGTQIHLKETDQLTSGYLKARTEHFRILQKQYWSLIVFKVLITAAMLIVGAVLLIDQQLNVGQFVAAELVILTVITAVEKFILNLDKVYDVLTALEKLGKVTGSEIEKDGSVVLPTTNQGVAVRFKDVVFHYGSDNNVLRNLSFDVKPGTHVAVMGESGSGKSTVLRLLTGAFNKFEGAVLVDEVPVGNYELASLRRQTGILLSLQDIFKASLLENITMGNPDVSINEVIHLAAITGLDEFVQAQKEGYDHILDPAGKRLPKKYIQAILLMRALLGRHRLLLLEEPCHYLDRKHIPGILSFLKEDSNATIIITTNDPEIAGCCDEVLLLNEGQLQARGTWEIIKNKIA